MPTKSQQATKANYLACNHSVFCTDNVKADWQELKHKQSDNFCVCVSVDDKSGLFIWNLLFNSVKMMPLLKRHVE